MHLVHSFAALAVTGCAAALPQSIPLDEVANIPGAPITKVPLGEGAGTKVVPYAPTQWFLDFADAANNAPVPSGYTLKFKNLKASNNDIGYLGYTTLDTYDTQACADLCTAKDGCSSINIYFERDPSLVPADACPNPAGTTVIKCVFWGNFIGASTAVNDGQWRDDFHVVIAGSNGYVDEWVPSIPGYSGAFLDNVAINAPNDCNGDNTYMGYKLFNDGQPFDAARCAAACEAETQYNLDHLDGRMLCKFFNTYVLNKNGVPQGQYCSMYTETWDKTYAVNDGQWNGQDHYTIKYSYSFSNTTDPGKPKLPCDVAAAQSAIVTSSLQPFCSTLLGYTTPVSTVVATQFTTVPASTLVTTLSPVTTTTTTVTRAAAKRDAVSPATPDALATFAATAVSSACSLQATPITETTTTSTTTVATVQSGTVTTTTTLPVSTTTTTATATPSATCTARGVNLVQNPGFENGMSSWTQTQYNSRTPLSWGASSGSYNGGSLYVLTAGSNGVGIVLSQPISGLTSGVTYTFTYMFSHTNSPASSINCSMNDQSFTSQSATGDSRTNQWLVGPDVYGTVKNTFVAKSTSTTLQCTIIANGVQTFRMDDVKIAC